jgi:1-acyl-sn-glycerol-3-phosphate acyltransferase
MIQAYAPLSFTQRLAIFLGKVVGWEFLLNVPTVPKYIIVGAPHTSNWDFPLAMLYKFATAQQMSWIGKAEIFRGPVGWFMRKLGGIPVDRSRRTNFVDQIIEIIHSRDQICIGISPEGTRKAANYWRSGFYYMAWGARIPIALAVIDYRRKILGITKILIPTGDLEADFQIIKELYEDVRGKFPEKQGDIQLRPTE